MKVENNLGLGVAGKGAMVSTVVKVEAFEYSEIDGAVKQNGTSILEGSLGGVDAVGGSCSLVVKEETVESLENMQLEDPLDTDKSNSIMNEVQVEEGIEEDDKEHRAEVSGTEHDVGITCENNVVGPYDFRNNEGNEAATSVHEHFSESTAVKEFEIFVGGLHRKAVEDELVDVFGSFGQLQSVRIVKNPSTQRSKGFAFIKYANVENARKVLLELKDGLEVRGKRVSLSASLENNTLFLENVCKTWTKNQVQETLITLGIDNVIELCLPSDPMNEGTNKGFAYLEFGSHSSAMTAFQRLRKPDAIFGSALSAKVAFSQSTLHFTKHELSQVKTVYIDHFPSSWDETKVRDVCKQYGEIEEVRLSRFSPKKRKKHFGFIDFVSRESAIACVDGINQASLGERECKVNACLAKPKKGSLRTKHSSQGGYLVELSDNAMDKPTLSKAGLQKSEGKKKKRKALQHLEAVKESKPSGLQRKDIGEKNSGVSRGKKREGKNMDSVHGRRTKKARNRHSGHSTGVPSQSYASTSACRSSDLEPHAGYLPARKQSSNRYLHAQTRATAYENRPFSNAGYPGGTTGGLRLQSYSAHSSYGAHQVGYSYPGHYGYQMQYY